MNWAARLGRTVADDDISLRHGARPAHRARLARAGRPGRPGRRCWPAAWSSPRGRRPPAPRPSCRPSAPTWAQARTRCRGRQPGGAAAGARGGGGPHRHRVGGRERLRRPTRCSTPRRCRRSTCSWSARACSSIPLARHAGDAGGRQGGAPAAAQARRRAGSLRCTRPTIRRTKPKCAAACVLRHLEAGRVPVALGAIDRVLTRRVRALLGVRGVVVRDETGWKLSTTRAAAHVMSALRACARQASSRCRARLAEERARGRHGIGPAAGAAGAACRRCATGPTCVRAIDGDDRPTLVAQRRSLARSDAVRARTGRSGWRRCEPCWPTPASGRNWPTMRPARRCWTCSGWTTRACRLGPAAAGRSAAVAGRVHGVGRRRARGGQLRAAAAPGAEQVVVLPLHQLLAPRLRRRSCCPAATRCACRPSPEPPGAWTAAQRAALGLPSREALEAVNARAAWRHALQVPALRRALAPQRRQRRAGAAPARWCRRCACTSRRGRRADPRELRGLPPRPVPRPLPQAPALPVDAALGQRLRGPAPLPVPLLRAAPARACRRPTRSTPRSTSATSATGCTRCCGTSTRRCTSEPARRPRPALLDRCAEAATRGLGLAQRRVPAVRRRLAAGARRLPGLAGAARGARARASTSAETEHEMPLGPVRAGRPHRPHRPRCPTAARW